MLWFEEAVGGLATPQVLNDSKTPSGPVHVGSLRGVLIHDAVYRELRARGVPARYLYGIDDYDPLDELPPADPEHFSQYLGMPLCNIPAPLGSSAGDLAEHYFAEFLDVFAELGVQADAYRMRDVYRSGAIDSEIDIILAGSDIVRRIYRDTAGAKRPDDWYPFQAICERCGRIGTTIVDSYDGQTVRYRCRLDLVKWAQGCGHSGRVSPFGGAGKLEWVAKWAHFKVTIEGAGKDHNTRGGSREVAVRCLDKLFDQVPPLNIPYEFFLVHGAKMSSSKGVGVTARQMADFLPPELLRFLMIRNLPKKPVDFAPAEDKVVRLYNDFDRLREKARQQAKDTADARLYQIVAPAPEPDYFAPAFEALLSLVQLPHIDLHAEVERLKGGPLAPLEREHLAARTASAQYWLSHFAGAGERLELRQEPPPCASSLTSVQLTFLHRLAADLATRSWYPQDLQVAIFNTARLTPIGQKDAFGALYCVLFSRESGPRAGNVLAFLDRDFVVERLRAEPAPALASFWAASSVPEQDLADWLAAVGGEVREISAQVLVNDSDGEPPGPGQRPPPRMAVLEVAVSLADGKTHLRRSVVMAEEGSGDSLSSERGRAQAAAQRRVGELALIVGRQIPLAAASAGAGAGVGVGVGVGDPAGSGITAARR